MKRLRILLLEDSADDAWLAIRSLPRSGVEAEALVARTGEEAARMLGLLGGEAPAALPDLLLLDARVPGLGGMALLELVRANGRTRGLRAAVLKGWPDPTLEARARELGAEFVQKPATLDAYEAAVAALVRAAAASPGPPE